MPGKNETPTALIFGVTGQDGIYLASALSARGYRVFGASRNAMSPIAKRAAQILSNARIELSSVDITSPAAVSTLIQQTQPTEIYNLAGETSVGRAIAAPAETLRSVTAGTLNILEAIRIHAPGSRSFHAASGEVFGETTLLGADEATAQNPVNPYGIAKSASARLVAFYREAYGLFACSGYLFNHESPLRPAQFVTKKIVKGALDILSGKLDQLRLGRLDVSRDWGWAPEYVEAFQLMLSADNPRDYVVATGEANTLEHFVELAFNCVGLNWRKFVVSDPNLFRATDTRLNCGNAARAKRELGWAPQHKLASVIDMMVAAERNERAEFQP